MNVLDLQVDVRAVRVWNVQAQALLEIAVTFDDLSMGVEVQEEDQSLLEIVVTFDDLSVSVEVQEED